MRACKKESCSFPTTSRLIRYMKLPLSNRKIAAKIKEYWGVFRDRVQLCCQDWTIFQPFARLKAEQNCSRSGLEFSNSQQRPQNWQPSLRLFICVKIILWL